MNNFTFAGQLGRDAVVHQHNGEQVINYSVAIDQGKDKDGRDNPPIWVNCSDWRPPGASVKVAEYLKKGQSVTVSGRATVAMYKTKEGLPAAELRCRVTSMTLQGTTAGRTEGGATSAASTAAATAPADTLPF